MSAKHFTQKKTRPEAFEVREALSPEQQSSLCSFLDSHTYQQAVAWAKKHFGLTISVAALSRFYHKGDTAKILAVISSGAAMNRKLDAAYEKNPAPEFARLVEVLKSIVMDLMLTGTHAPDKLELANALLKSALDYLKEQGRAEVRKLDERKVVMLEKKAAAFDQVKTAIHSGGLTPATLTKIERELKLL